MQAAVPSIVFYLRDKDATNSHVYDGPLVETEGMSGIFFFPSPPKSVFHVFFFKYSSVLHMSLVETEGMRILYFYCIFYFYSAFRGSPSLIRTPSFRAWVSYVLK